MASSAEVSMGVSDRPGRVATARGLLITQRPPTRTAQGTSGYRDGVILLPDGLGEQEARDAVSRANLLLLFVEPFLG